MSSELRELHPNDLDKLSKMVASRILDDAHKIPVPETPSQLPDVLTSADRASVQPFLVESGPERLVRALIQQMVSGFRSEEWIKNNHREMTNARLEELGFDVSEGGIRKTANTVRGMMTWHRWKVKTLLAGLGALILGVIVGTAKKIGLPVSSD